MTAFCLAGFLPARRVSSYPVYRSKIVVTPQGGPLVPAEKSVPADTVDLAGGHGMRFSAIMSVFLLPLLTLRSCAREDAISEVEGWQNVSGTC
jgi:hypothetical protein